MGVGDPPLQYIKQYGFPYFYVSQYTFWHTIAPLLSDHLFEKELLIRFTKFLFVLFLFNVILCCKLSDVLPVIHLQFWAYGSLDSLFPISMSPTANLWVHNIISNDKSAMLLHPRTRWNKNFASQSQNYAQKNEKMQDAQAELSLGFWKQEFRTPIWQKVGVPLEKVGVLL